MRVVIADAMKARLEYTRQLMLRLGYTIVASGNDGIWAVTFCRKHTPDIAILDDDLPQLSVERVVAALRRDESARYIIIGGGGNKQSGVMDRDALIVPKPFTASNMGDAVQKLKSGLVIPGGAAAPPQPAPAAQPRDLPMADFGMTRSPLLPRRR